MSVCLSVCLSVCMHEFPDDNDQEILEPKLLNIFVSTTLNELFLL